MILNKQKNFRAVYSRTLCDFRDFATIVHTETWQGTDVSKKPEMATYELEDYIIEFPVGTEDLAYHQTQIGPNLPWADRHFELDRVSGEPLNPGKTWNEWPYAHSANTFRKDYGQHGEPQFNHTYAERMWPKWANLTDKGEMLGNDTRGVPRAGFGHDSHRGIRYPYGDLGDVIDLLVRHPHTRGAYLPLTFPEDTGIVHGERTPCSIGYLFRMRNDRLSMSYDIRSCDFKRHFQDDVYLTLRLLLWVLAECRKKDERWNSVKPGNFLMHIGSFHIFKADWRDFMGSMI